MKYYLPLLFFFLSLQVLQAQDADSVDLSEIVEQSETEASEESYDDYEEAEEGPSHTLVTPEALTKTQEYNNEKITLRKFDRDKWKEIVGTSNFEEEPEKVEEQDDNKPAKKIGSPTVPWSSPVLKTIAYAIIIGLVAFILILIFKNVSLGTRIGNKKLEPDDLAAPVENIEELDVDTLLRRTLAEGNFKLAVRLYFLGLLKKLNAAGIIVWKKDKTNRDYLTELFSKNFHFDEIRYLTLAYELIWYGEHTVAKESYEKLFTEFERIDQQIIIPNAS